jgi:hypothetical protein
MSSVSLLLLFSPIAFPESSTEILVIESPDLLPASEISDFRIKLNAYEDVVEKNKIDGRINSATKILAVLFLENPWKI